MKNEKCQLDVTLKLFNPLVATGKEWEAFHKWRSLYHHDFMSELPTVDDVTFEKGTKENFTNKNSNHLLLMSMLGQEQIGASALGFKKENSTSFTEQKKEIKFNIKILKKYKGKGVEFKFLKQIIDIAKENNKTILINKLKNF